jgi:hypothetical protein
LPFRAREQRGNLTQSAVKVAPKIIVSEPAYCFATWDRVLLQIWRLEVTAESVETLRKVGKAFVEQNRDPVSTLSIVESTSPAPSDRLRGALSSFYRELAPYMKEQIVVAEGSGFRAALVRSVGLALSAVAPKSLPFKFVGGVEEAAQLIRPHLSPAAGGAAALQEAIKNVREQTRLAAASAERR